MVITRNQVEFAAMDMLYLATLSGYGLTFGGGEGVPRSEVGGRERWSKSPKWMGGFSESNRSPQK